VNQSGSAALPGDPSREDRYPEVIGKPLRQPFPRRNNAK
jgi:hypothetical protein